ncbi:MAG: hypothetical protein ABSE69_05265, partial [Roseiarcus sp.]
RQPSISPASGTCAISGSFYIRSKRPDNMSARIAASSGSHDLSNFPLRTAVISAEKRVRQSRFAYGFSQAPAVKSRRSGHPVGRLPERTARGDGNPT